MAISSERYSTSAILLHWLIAVLLIGNIGLAWYFNTLHGPAAAAPVALHRSIGITVLLLSLARLALRLAVRPPPLPAGLAAWERWASKAVHVLFYVVMIGLPLTGWAMVSVGPHLVQTPMTLFNLIPWPAIAPLTTVPAAQVHPTHELFEAAHGLMGKLAYVLIVLHVLAALKHQLIDRDTVVGRMAPFLAR
ncbi:MAG: cytochrome b/b6 domain-containing protein [Caulobacteraceae bacterium]|nr:cytochrome b/b6 domain-containing protein [Caulobacteraceae bacterium]